MKVLEQTLNSQEVAEMVGKEHKELLRDIRRYCGQLGESKIALTDFFVESTYRTEQNKEMPCYNVTRKGCEFVAHKLTGIKGTDFTARYINRFHNMEQVIKNEVLPTQELSPELQMFKSIFDQVAKQELENKQIKQDVQNVQDRVEGIREIVALNPNDWRKDSSNLINKMAIACGGYEHIRVIREESYRLLEQRYGVALNIRLTNKKKTMSLNGVCKSKLDKLNQLDVIADDKKLIEGYISIVKEMAIKYGVS